MPPGIAIAGLPFPPGGGATSDAVGPGDARALQRESDGAASDGDPTASLLGVPRTPHASQSRRDALTGRWAIFAPGRSERPAEIGDVDLPRLAGHSCPFCGGHEHYTPAPSLVVRDPTEPRGHWAVRVVPNLFPAVSHQIAESLLDEPSNHHQPSPYQHSKEGSFVGSHSHCVDSHCADSACADASLESVFAGEGEESDELFEVNELHGGHEVVIETPHHLESLTDLSQAHAGRVFEAYAARMRHWYDVPGVEYVVTFKNVGAAAGASLRHTHSQLIATSLLPPSVTEIGRRVENHFQRSDCCLMCATLAGELEDGRRVVSESERFIAYCPFASRMPYLVRIAPRAHADRFELTLPAGLEELAGLVQGVLRSLESTFVSCAYNYTIHTRPRNVASPSSFHWWMELFPRLTKVAGFEWSSDCFINPVPPEMAATHLRRERCGRIKRTANRNSADFSD